MSHSILRSINLSLLCLTYSYYLATFGSPFGSCSFLLYIFFLYEGYIKKGNKHLLPGEVKGNGAKNGEEIEGPIGCLIKGSIVMNKGR